MQQIGDINNHKPFTIERLGEIYNNYDGRKELIHLNLDSKLRPEGVIFQPAAILVLRNFYNMADLLFKDLMLLNWDTKALMRGEVKNKQARYNLCFADFEQEPEKGKGRVIMINKIDEMLNLQKQIEKLTNLNNLNAEGNLYFDVEKCGIGSHGEFIIFYHDKILLYLRFCFSFNIINNSFIHLNFCVYHMTMMAQYPTFLIFLILNLQLYIYYLLSFC